MEHSETPAWMQAPVSLGVRAAAVALAAPPLRVMQDAATLLGRWWGRRGFNRHRLERAKNNIAWCFPQWSPAQVEECAISAYGRLFAMVAEVAASPRIMDGDGWLSRIRVGDIGAALDLMISGRPSILITGHCGNWEIMGCALGRFGVPMHALYRPFRNKPLDDWVRATRMKHGLRLVSKFGAGDALPAIMERGETVGFIADQNAGPRGLFVPFFDRLASTYKSIGLLALRHEAPIICGQARMEAAEGGGERRFVLEVVDIIDPESWRDQPDPLFYVTARYRRALEMMVRRAPEQYLWMHRYWKSRPRHELEGRPFPDALRAKLRALPWMTDEELSRIETRSEQDAGELAASGPSTSGAGVAR